GAVAPALVHTFFDQRWAGIEAELAILSVLSAVRPIGWIGRAYLRGEERPRGRTVLETRQTAAGGDARHRFRRARARRIGPGGDAGRGGGRVWGVSALLYGGVPRGPDRPPRRPQPPARPPPVLACVPMVVVVAALEHALAGAAVPAGLRLSVEVAAGAIVFAP